jgi:hypothetical protein
VAINSDCHGWIFSKCKKPGCQCQKYQAAPTGDDDSDSGSGIADLGSAIGLMLSGSDGSSAPADDSSSSSSSDTSSSFDSGASLDSGSSVDTSYDSSSSSGGDF